MSFITSYCRIRNSNVIVNGESFFSGNGTGEEFAIGLYESLKIDYPKFYKMDNLSKLGFLAAEFVLENETVRDPYGTAIILSNSSGSLDTDLQYQQASTHMPSPALFVYTLPNIVAGEICIRHKIKGESNFFVSPEYDSDFLSSYLHTLLAGSITTCVAGWVEVLGKEADVFLYLVKNERAGLAIAHTPQNLNNLYKQKHG